MIDEVVIQVTCGELKKVIGEQLQPVIDKVERLAEMTANTRSALDLFATDPHRFGDRPCQTCANVSKLLGEQWGCYKNRKDIQFGVG